MAKNTDKKTNAVGFGLGLESIMPNKGIKPQEPVVQAVEEKKNEVEVEKKEEVTVPEQGPVETEPAEEKAEPEISAELEEEKEEREGEKEETVSKESPKREKGTRKGGKDPKRKSEVKLDQKRIFEKIMSMEDRPRKAFSLYLSVDNIVKLEYIAEQNGLTKSKILDDILTEVLKDI